MFWIPTTSTTDEGRLQPRAGGLSATPIRKARRIHESFCVVTTPSKVHSRRYHWYQSLILHHDHAHKGSQPHHRQPVQPITFRWKPLILHHGHAHKRSTADNTNHISSGGNHWYCISTTSTKIYTGCNMTVSHYNRSIQAEIADSA